MTLPAFQEEADWRREPVFEETCLVRTNQPVAAGYRLLVLEAPPHILNCSPGQFFHLLCPVRERLRPYLRRPMSIYGYDSDRRELRFLYKVIGTGTGALATLEPGDPLTVLGPLGQGFEIRQDWNRLMLVARGVGLATLAPLALEARRLDRTLTAICSARSPRHLMSTEYFLGLGAEVITLTDSESTSGMDALWEIINSRLPGNTPGGGIDALYTCGSNRILKLLQSVGKAYGIPGQVALEQQMACGLGMCQCCVRSFRTADGIVHKRVCNQGPVFDLQEPLGWS